MHPTARVSGAPLARNRSFPKPGASARRSQQGGQTLLAGRPRTTLPEVPSELISDLEGFEATYQSDGNTPELRLAIRTRLNSWIGSNGENGPGAVILAFWLARYSIMAGDASTTYEALLHAPQHESMRLIRALLDPSQARPGNAASGYPSLLPGTYSPTIVTIWEAFPCNYYTYRYTLTTDEWLGKISDAIDDYHVPPSLLGPLQYPGEQSSAAHTTPMEPEVSRPRTALPGDVDPYGDPPPTSDEPDQDPTPPAEITAATMARPVIDCMRYWSESIGKFYAEKFTGSCRSLEKALWSVLTYLAQRYETIYTEVLGDGEGPETLLDLYNFLITFGMEVIGETDEIQAYMRERHRTLDLDTLYKHDWKLPAEFSGVDDYNIYLSEDGLLNALEDALGSGTTAANAETVVRQKVDAPLIMMGLFFIPIAIAEASRKYRDYETAVALLQAMQQLEEFVLVATPLCALIEIPFHYIQLGQMLFEKGEWQYKAGTPAEPIEYENGVAKHQGLAAYYTYEDVLAVFDSNSSYASLVYDGAQQQKEDLKAHLDQYTMNPLALSRSAPGTLPPLWNADAQQYYDKVSHSVPISTIVTGAAGLVGATPARPYEQILSLTDGPHLETNPVIYSVVSSATARMQQIDAGLNYLGYREDYVPPWRFQYLLQRARYFAEHAKSAENEYINFLSNAEREEYQELTMQQQVTLADANVQLETAKVQVAQYQCLAAKESVELAKMTADDAQDKADNYAYYNQQATQAADDQMVVSAFTTFASVAVSLATIETNPLGAVSAASSIAGLINQESQNEVNAEQREMEQQSYEMAAAEAEQAAAVAEANYNVAVASLNVATIQKSIALLNQQFAVQNLQYLQDRTLNAEMWYRLASMVRAIGETYLQRAMELAFLAQRAYNFEEDRTLKVIRFDYDQDEVSGLLAADYLLSDLDTLEFDQAVSQHQRQQQVRYVASFAREYPATLQQLRETGSVIFSLSLEQLERRFPGLYNIRIGSVEVTPTALMDSSRFSLVLTHLGKGQIRMSAAAAAEMIPQESTDIASPPVGSPPSGSPPGSEQESNGQDNQSWIYPYDPDVDQAWPMVFLTTGQETALYSGLSRPDRDSAFSFTVTNQRGAFEGLCAASSWCVDMSMQQNQIDPSTLTDLVVSFTVSGFFDPRLRAGIEQAPVQQPVLSQWLSAQRDFPDALFDLQESAKATMQVPASLLSLGSSPGALRNIGFVLTPSASRTQFGNLMSSHVVYFEVTEDFHILELNDIPQITFNYVAETLSLEANVSIASDADIYWNFGDDTGWISQDTHDDNDDTHVYTRPGSYIVTVRLVRDGGLVDYTSTVAISATVSCLEPLTVRPVLNEGTVAAGRLQVLVSSDPVDPDDPYTCLWKLGSDAATATPPDGFNLLPGRYLLTFVATRDLQVRVSNTQRYMADSDPTELTMKGLKLLTNREFEPGGGEITGSEDYNGLTAQLFAAGPISPVDRWTLEFLVNDDENLFLRTVNKADEPSIALGDIDDLILRLEYETR